MIRILAFDAGITHVGMVEAEASGAAWDDLRVTSASCIDLAAIAHRRVPREACTLHHGNSLADRFAHFAQEFAPQLDAADCILVEQQPPGSAGQVFEQLLLFSRRSKTRAIHPRSVHKHHGHGHLDYDGRKAAAERVAAPWLAAAGGVAGGAAGGAAGGVAGAARQHDIADAVCILLFEQHRRRLAAPPDVASGVKALLQSFAFTGPLPGRVGGKPPPPR